MTSRRSSRPAVQHVSYLGQCQPTPATGTPQAMHQTIPSLNSTIQARYQTLNYLDRTYLPLASASRTAGVSSRFSTPMADPELPSRINTPSSPSIADYLIATLRPMFAAHQESTSTRIDQLGSSIEKLGLIIGNLSTQIKDLQKEAQDQTQESAGILERVHEAQLSTSRMLTVRLAKLEKVIGTSDDQDDEKSLLNRLDTITYAVEELLERSEDPDAPLSDAGLQLGSDTYCAIDLTTPESQEFKPYVNVEVDLQTPEPDSQFYVNNGADSRMPKPVLDVYAEPTPIRCEIGIGTARQVYTDVAICPKTPEPLPPLPAHHEFGTSPIRRSYLNAATGPRTPSPLISTRGSLHLSSLSRHRFSSGALTIVGDASDLEFKLPVDLVNSTNASDPVHVGSSSKLKPKSQSSNVPIPAHFTHVPAASKSLSPADWSTIENVRHRPHVDNVDDDELDEPVVVFHPDVSSSMTQNLTLLKGGLDSREESVRSLRLTTLGDSFAGPTTSSPPHEIFNIPLSSRPPLSPPLPYSLSPSCSPRLLSPQPQTPQDPVNLRQPTRMESHSRATPPRRPFAQAAPSPVQTSTPEYTSIWIQADGAKTIPNIPVSEPSPAYATSTPVLTPAKKSTQGSVDQIQETILMSSRRSLPFTPNSLEVVSISQLIPDTSISPEAPKDNFISPSRRSYNSSSAPHIDSPVVPDELHEMSNLPLPPLLLTNTITDKFSLPKHPSHLNSLTKPPFIDLRGSPSTKAYLPRDFQNPHLTSTTKPIKAPKTPRLPKPSTSKVPENSPIYISSGSLSPISDLTSQSESDDVKVIPVKRKVKLEASKSGLPPPKKKYHILKVGPPEKESAAATRVKKRRAKPSDTTSEPPLKRARQKAEAAKGEVIEIEPKDKDIRGKGKEIKDKDPKKDSKGKNTTSSNISAKDKTKRTKARAKPLPGSEWPPKSQVGGAKFHQKFIECESCYYWYHYGCVGIKPGDRLVGARDFVCPPCSSNGANPLIPSGKGVVCARPDCGEASTDEYFVAGIIGRATKVEGGRGRRYLWLVKWEGYPIGESTWEEEEVMSDPQKLIEDFTAAAEKEGLPDDPHITLLLKEAIEGGCKDLNA